MVHTPIPKSYVSGLADITWISFAYMYTFYVHFNFSTNHRLQELIYAPKCMFTFIKSIGLLPLMTRTGSDWLAPDREIVWFRIASQNSYSRMNRTEFIHHQWYSPGRKQVTVCGLAYIWDLNETKISKFIMIIIGRLNDALLYLK